MIESYVAVVQQFARDSPYERPYHDTDQAAHEQARDHAYRGADHSGPCAAEQFGHVPRQKIIRRSHRGRQPRPQPHLGGRQRRIAACIGAKKPRIAQHRAGQDGDNATHDADEATEESRYGEEYVHLVRFLSFHGSRCGRRIYSTLPDGWSPCRERPPTGGTSSPPRIPCGRRRR